MIQDKLHAHISPSRNLHSRGLITENDMEENGNNNNKKIHMLFYFCDMKS